MNVGRPLRPASDAVISKRYTSVIYHNQIPMTLTFISFYRFGLPLEICGPDNQPYLPPAGRRHPLKEKEALGVYTKHCPRRTTARQQRSFYTYRQHTYTSITMSTTWSSRAGDSWAQTITTLLSVSVSTE